MASPYQQPAGYPQVAQSNGYDSLLTGMNSMSLSGAAPPTAGQPTPPGQTHSPYPAQTRLYSQPPEIQPNPYPSFAPAPGGIAYPAAAQPQADQQFNSSSTYPQTNVPISTQPQYSIPATGPSQPSVPTTISYGYPNSVASQVPPYDPQVVYQHSGAISPPTTSTPQAIASTQYQNSYQPASIPQSAQYNSPPATVPPTGYQYPPTQTTGQAPATTTTPVPSTAQSGYAAPVPYEQYPQQQTVQGTAPASATRDVAQAGQQYPQQGKHRSFTFYDSKLT